MKLKNHRVDKAFRRENYVACSYYRAAQLARLAKWAMAKVVQGQAVNFSSGK